LLTTRNCDPAASISTDAVQQDIARGRQLPRPNIRGAELALVREFCFGDQTRDQDAGFSHRISFRFLPRMNTDLSFFPIRGPLWSFAAD
jgi:hypothetical protein